MDTLKMADSVMAGAANVAEWQRDFMRRFVGPIMQQRAQIAWASLTPEQKEMLKQAAPEQYAQIVKVIQTKGK